MTKGCEMLGSQHFLWYATLKVTGSVPYYPSFKSRHCSFFTKPFQCENTQRAARALKCIFETETILCLSKTYKALVHWSRADQGVGMIQEPVELLPPPLPRRNMKGSCGRQIRGQKAALKTLGSGCTYGSPWAAKGK